MELLKDVYPGLETTYHTPHLCGNCMEHIGADWSYCPECGTPTGLTAADVKESEEIRHGNV